MTDITKKGTPVPTRFGIIHVGDTVKVVLYESTDTGGTKLTTYTGELVYHKQEARFLIKDPEKGLSYNLNQAEQFEIIKKWDEK